MPCKFFKTDEVCDQLSRKGKCKKLTYPEGHPFCGHDKTLLALRKELKKGKNKVSNWRKWK